MKTIVENTVKENKKKKSKTTLEATKKANVNSYKHFLVNPTINHPFVNWAIGLRFYDKPKSIVNSGSIVPEVYHKQLEGSKNKHTSADFGENVNISEFQHMTLHRLGNASAGQLVFETSLRKHSSQELLNREKGWSSFPKKQRNEEVKLLKSTSLKKKIIQPEDYDNALDGRQNFPKFSEKINKSRNANEFKHFIKGSVNLPSIGWQTNLREY